MKHIICQHIDPYQCPARWMAFAYFDVMRQKRVYFIYPFHFIVAFAWWLQCLWARHANAPSWIEREARRRAEQSYRVITRSEPLLTPLIDLVRESESGCWRCSLDYDNYHDGARILDGDGNIIGECYDAWPDDMAFDPEAGVRWQFSQAIKRAIVNTGTTYGAGIPFTLFSQ